VRVFWFSQTRARNESDSTPRWEALLGGLTVPFSSAAPPADPGSPIAPSRARWGVRESSQSTPVRTRKVVNYTCARRSQRKLWWKLVAIRVITST